MAEVPEIVRQRLARQGGGDHPDADLLTAFAEKSLPERERAQVLAHLSACAPCREVISLALPETPAPRPAVAPARTGWLRWPVLRWGALAAAVVVVIAAVGLRTTLRSRLNVGERSSAPVLGQQENAPAKAAPAPQQTIAPAAQEGKALAKQRAPAAKHERLQANASPITQHKDAGLAGAPAPESVSTATDAVVSMAESRAKVAAPAPAPTAENISSAPAMRKSEPAITAGAVRPSVGGALAGQSAAAMNARVGPLKSPLVRVSMVPRWRVSDDGTLERSADGGQTWQVVQVQGGPVFRAVSAAGDDIWAGGAGGALFHSSNGGQSWARVVPHSDGISLTSDIVRVEFSDLSRGVVTAASGETWFTTDGGHTWTVRRP